MSFCFYLTLKLSSKYPKTANIQQFSNSCLELSKKERIFSHLYFADLFARMAELAYAPDLGSGRATCGGSSPPSRTFTTTEIIYKELTVESNDYRCRILEKGYNN